jgi:DNA-binding NarL/FixJ family response regulator
MTSAGRILVVDDVARNIRLLEALLTPEGYEVIGAGSGSEALERVADRSPDVVLLDIRMPDVDGYEVCRRIRADPEQAFLPIIMVTSAEDEERVRALEAGADDFVAKPLNPPELLARLLPRFGRGKVHSPGELTEREREVLALVAEGLSNAAIAESLVVSVHTVRNHIASLSAKLGAHSKLEALSIAVRQGLLPDL